MKTRLMVRSVFRIVPSTVIPVLVSAPVHAQWVNVPAGATPRGPDGKPNLSAAAAQLPDGHPDLSGISEDGSNKCVLNVAADLNPGDVPFQPWVKALVD